MNTLITSSLSDSGILWNNINEFICQVNQAPEDETIADLRYCDMPVLNWLLNEVSIPNGQYDLAGIVMELIEERA